MTEFPKDDDSTRPDYFLAPLGYGMMANSIGVDSVSGMAQRMPATLQARDELIYRIIGYGQSESRVRLFLPSPLAVVTPQSYYGETLRTLAILSM